jgi:predicted dehydrogenase
VEKPAFPGMPDYELVRAARDRAGRIVLVGENDHYKPLAITLRKLLADDAIGELVFGHFTTIAYRPKSGDDWRNDEAMAGGDAFFEEGIHWLHLARQPRPDDYGNPRLSTRRVEGCQSRRRSPREEHAGRVRVR